MDKKTHDKGLEIRKAVLGEAYVANALKNADDFNKPFQELVTEYCWGAVWGRARNCRARPAACSTSR
jgi:4-carboxymuconolactone decarboxylase